MGKNRRCTELCRLLDNIQAFECLVQSYNRYGQCMQLRSSSIKGTICSSNSSGLRSGRSRTRDNNNLFKGRTQWNNGRVIMVGQGKKRRSNWETDEIVCLLNACLMDLRVGWPEMVQVMHRYNWKECTKKNIKEKYRELKAIFTAWKQIITHTSGETRDPVTGCYEFSPDQQMQLERRTVTVTLSWEFHHQGRTS